MKNSALKLQSAAFDNTTQKQNPATPTKFIPRKYKDEFPMQAFKLCLLGATTTMLAYYFNVTDSCIQKWVKKIPAFGEAVARGRKAADMEVAHSLYLSALDRVVTLRQAIKLKEVYYDENGKRAERERVEVVDVEKHIPGDYRAQQFWLRNRNPEKWGLKWDDGGEPKNVVNLNLGAGHDPLSDEAAG